MHCMTPSTLSQTYLHLQDTVHVHGNTSHTCVSGPLAQSCIIPAVAGHQEGKDLTTHGTCSWSRLYSGPRRLHINHRVSHRAPAGPACFLFLFPISCLEWFTPAQHFNSPIEWHWYCKGHNADQLEWMNGKGLVLCLAPCIAEGKRAGGRVVT